MEIARAVIAVLLGWPAYRLASLWGRFYFNLYGLNSQVEVSYGYLRPLRRLIGFYLPLVTLLIAIWWLWPWGQWGLLSLLTTSWGFKCGMRCEMLRQFVYYLLLNLELCMPYERAWSRAKVWSKASNVQRHFSNPYWLVSYVASTTRVKDEGPALLRRWDQLLPELKGPSAGQEADSFLNSSPPDWLLSEWRESQRAGISPDTWAFDGDSTWRQNLEWMAEFDPEIRELEWWKDLIRKNDEADF